MPRPKIEDHIVERIEELWASDPSQRAKEVFAKADKAGLIKWVRGPEGKPTPSKRKVEEIVHNAREKAKKAGPLPPEVELTPWCDGLPWDDPEANVFLFKLLYVSKKRSELGGSRPITVREAKWALKLHRHFESIPEPYKTNVLLSYTHKYARSEIAAKILGKPKAYTAPSDGALMYRIMGSDERLQEYLEAVDKSILPAIDYEQEFRDVEAVEPGFTKRLLPVVLHSAKYLQRKLDSPDLSTEERIKVERSLKIHLRIKLALEKLHKQDKEGGKQ